MRFRTKDDRNVKSLVSCLLLVENRQTTETDASRDVFFLTQYSSQCTSRGVFFRFFSTFVHLDETLKNTRDTKTRLLFVLRSKCEYYFITTIRTTITTLTAALVKRRAVTACDGRRRRRRERRLFHPRERYRAVLFWRRRICCCSRSCKTWICGLNRWFPRRRRRRCRIDRRF